jgi:hypothetical protein
MNNCDLCKAPAPLITCEHGKICLNCMNEKMKENYVTRFMTNDDGDIIKHCGNISDNFDEGMRKWVDDGHTSD